MIRRPADIQSPVRIHSSLKLEDYERLTALARDENSSVSRIVKLAVIEFLNRRLPLGGESSNRSARTMKRG